MPEWAARLISTKNRPAESVTVLAIALGVALGVAVFLVNNAALMVEMVGALEAQGMVPEQAINEYGAGQQEISIRHTDALGAADNQMKFRDTVRGVALRHGLLASFAPKPFPEQIGSGAHVHFSLWDGEGDGARSVLYDKSAPRGLSAIGRHFIAGVTEHLPALVALTAPSYNSYSRLVPSAWASATTAWGFDNKEAALRVCSPFYQREEQSYNVEFKTVDASSNPYLALGALIACGLDGIERELDSLNGPFHEAECTVAHTDHAPAIALDRPVHDAPDHRIEAGAVAAAGEQRQGLDGRGIGHSLSSLPDVHPRVPLTMPDASPRGA